MNIEQILEILREQDDLFGMVEGCSDAEIEKTEAMATQKLPVTYKTFLARMGKNAGAFMRGSSAFFDDLPDLKGAAEELLTDNRFPKTLPPGAFVFWMHQGYQFAFFFPRESDNPAVFYYGEGEGMNDFTSVGTLTDFFTRQLRFSGF